MFRNRILTIKLLGNYSDCEDFIDICLIKHRVEVDNDLVDIDGVKMRLISCELPRDKDFHYYDYGSSDSTIVDSDDDIGYDAIIYVKPTCKDDWKDKYKKNWETHSDSDQTYKYQSTCRKVACVAIEYDPAISTRPWECLSEIPDLIKKHTEVMKKITLLESAKESDKSVLSLDKMPNEVTALIQFSLFNVSTQIQQRAQNVLLEKAKEVIDSYSHNFKVMYDNYSRNCKMM